MADAGNIGRINIWRNSTIAASAAAAEPGSEAFGRMSIYRTGAIARSRRHHEVPGGGGYTASAVHFDGSASLAIAALQAPGDNTGFCSFAMWLKFAAPVSSGELWCLNPDSDQNGFSSLDNDGGDVPLGMSIYDSGGGQNLGTESGSDPLVTATWQIVMASFSTNLAAGDKILQIYIGDTAYGFAEDASADAFLMTFDEQAFAVGRFAAASATKYVGDMANFWFAPGQFIDFSVESNRRKFIDASGKPVNLGSDGSTPTGVAPAIFFAGNAAAFPTNAGTGGAFTLTGSLTNATTSPSD